MISPTGDAGRTRILQGALALLCGTACGGEPGGEVMPPPPPEVNVIVMAQMTGGVAHSCAISGFGSGLPLGTGFCWGNNQFGQLGDGGGFSGVGEFSLEPVPISGGIRFLRLAAGGDFTCGVAQGELAAYCWGGGIVGQDSPGPVRVDPDLEFRELSSGTSHVCGLTFDGDVWCWGGNASGQLAQLDPAGGPAPILVDDMTAHDVSAGVGHTCVVEPAGTIACWGDNASGQLGIGSSGDSLRVPVRVDAALVFTAVSAGGQHTCGLTEDGTAYCWGANVAGQLGSAGDPTATLPRRVSGNRVFRELVTGDRHTCGVTEDDGAFCWGANGAGQLGNGDLGGVALAPDSVRFDLPFQSLSAGDEHTCATARDLGYCWGRNVFGQLGTGSTTPSAVPLRVTGRP